MVEMLEFIFGGTVLWGTVRYAGVCFLVFIVMGCLAAALKGTKK